MKKRNKKTLFSLSVQRIPGGYDALCRVATDKGYLTLHSCIKKSDVAAGLFEESPQSAALSDVLGQAAEIAASPYGENHLSSRTRYAILATVAARKLMDYVREGDPDARRALRHMARSSSPTLRKAVHAQRLFGEG